MLGAFRRRLRPSLPVCLIALCGTPALRLSCCCCCCCVSPCSGAGVPAEDRAGSAVVLARAISPDSRRRRRSSGNVLSLLPDSSGHVGSILALFWASATVAAAGGWDRWTEQCCVGLNATSPTTDGRGEDEPRGWDYFSVASEQRGAVLLATSRLLAIKSDRHAFTAGRQSFSTGGPTTFLSKCSSSFPTLALNFLTITLDA